MDRYFIRVEHFFLRVAPVSLKKCRIRGQRIYFGLSGVCPITQGVEKNSEGDGDPPGHLSQSGSQLRTGVANHSRPCGKANAVPLSQETGCILEAPGLLENQAMSRQTPKVVSRLGVQVGDPLLVHIGNHLWRERPERLARKDRFLQELWGPCTPSTMVAEIPKLVTKRGQISRNSIRQI